MLVDGRERRTSNRRRTTIVIFSRTVSRSIGMLTLVMAVARYCLEIGAAHHDGERYSLDGLTAKRTYSGGNAQRQMLRILALRRGGGL